VLDLKPSPESAADRQRNSKRWASPWPLFIDLGLLFESLQS
jgi:hypothetical protein